MSAEAWRRRGTHLTPRLFAWQVWYFQHLRLVLRGRRATFGTFLDVRGSLATKGDPFDAAAFCVAGVTLSAPQARFAWQACYFRYLPRCPRKLGDEGGPIWRRGFLRDRCGTFSTLGSFCVAGVLLSVPSKMSAEAWRRRGAHLTPRLFAWQVWYFQHLRLVLRGRRATFGTFVDVRGSLATKGDPFDAAAFCVAGVALSAPQARFAWQACYFRYLPRCPRKLGDEGGPIWRRGFCVTGVVLSAP